MNTQYDWYKEMDKPVWFTRIYIKRLKLTRKRKIRLTGYHYEINIYNSK